jgi:hypothetical protein
MKIKADYTEINSLGNYLISEAGNIVLMENKIKETLGKISSNWIGLDSNIFIARGEEYIKQIDMIQDRINKSGGLLTESVEDYKEVESKYANLVGEV